MAEKRMFSKAIVDGDDFLDLPPMAQLLYFHLGMRADDDGFVNNPRRIQSLVGASVSDMNALKSGEYILSFDSGIIVIRHWRTNNLIRSDRYKPTAYVKERELLALEKDGSYTFKPPENSSVDGGKPRGKPCVNHDENNEENHVENRGIPNDNQRYTQYREGEEKLISIVTRNSGNTVYHDGIPKSGGVCYIAENQEKILVEKLGYETYQRYRKKLTEFIIRNNAHVKSPFETILKWYEEDIAKGYVKPEEKKTIGFDLDEFFNAACLKGDENE